MLGVRFSLFTRIMLWFFLNLLILGAILLLIFNFRFDSRSSSFLRSSNRIEAVTRQIESETSEKSRTERDEILKKYSEQYRVEFFLFDREGRQLAGRETTLPDEIFKEITRPEGAPPERPASSTASGETRLPPPNGQSPLSVYLKTTNPPLYWFVGRIMTIEPEKSEPVRARVLAATDSYTGNGLFFDVTPFIIIAIVIIGFSTVFWFPFIRNITGTIGQMTAATEKIAEEEFDARVSEKRTDELGKLGGAINHLAKRLSGFVTGQKRFLGDISHELNSPLARMQFALSILEDRVDENNRAYVADVKEEVELMSKLVGELLTYSKAGMKTTQVNLESVRLKPLVEMVVGRETATENADVKMEVSENIEALAQPELLARALGNVVRNAVRYAGRAGMIRVSAENGNNQVKIIVEDKGAGVPEADIEKLFDPFYRIESDRSRQTGGTGLGLAIVKTCVEACQGKVFAENRSPSGFAITLLLKSSKSEIKKVEE